MAPLCSEAAEAAGPAIELNSFSIFLPIGVHVLPVLWFDGTVDAKPSHPQWPAASAPAAEPPASSREPSSSANDSATKPPTDLTKAQIDISGTALLTEWRQLPSGRVEGKVSGKAGYADGTPFETGIVREKHATHVVTINGTIYRLGTPAPPSLATSRSRRTSSARTKSLTLADFPVRVTEVLAPRDVGPTWCAVVSHIEGKLLIQTPESARETLSLIDLQRWMRRSTPALTFRDVVRACAPVEESTTATAAVEDEAAELDATWTERHVGRTLRAKHTEAAPCPWVGKPKVTPMASTMPRRSALQPRARSDSNQRGDAAAALDGRVTSGPSYEAIGHKRGLFSHRRHLGALSEDMAGLALADQVDSSSE